LASVLAIYQPVSPVQGTYTWELIVNDERGPDTYTAGRTTYDFVSGYVRIDSYNSTSSNPGINGVTIWDLRESTPHVYTVDANAQCWVEKLDSNVTAPTVPDWSAFKFARLTYFNKALVEQWIDVNDVVLYVDVFNRDVVGTGILTPDEDGETIFYSIDEWTDEKPDGTNFLLPTTIPCRQVNALQEYKPFAPMLDRARKVHQNGALFNLKCTACKIGINLVLGRLCTGLGAAACAPFPPAIPFCGILASLACKKGAKIGTQKACQIIKLC